MILDKIALEICFELNNDPKNFKLTDTTDYASEGIALTDVEGLFKITSPDGTIAYENAGFATNDFSSQDIDVDISTLFDTVSLPLDSENEVQLGNYLIEYKIEVIGGVQPGVYTKSFTVENCHVDPIVDVNFITDCFNSKLTSTDNTDYSTELVPNPTSIVRTHTAYSPPTSGLSDTVTSNKILVASPISTKTWTLEVSSIVRWDYPDGLCIINTLVGDIEAEITCDVSICDIFCCIDKLYKRYQAQLGLNSVLASQIKDQLDIVSIDLVLFENALKCGHNDKAQGYYDHILEVSGCEPGCSCTDVDTVQVIPVCVVTGTAVVDACGNGAITVTPNTVGNTTTYTVCFDQDLLDKLNNLTPGGEGLFKEVTIDITAAEMRAMHTTKKQLLPDNPLIAYNIENIVLLSKKNGAAEYVYVGGSTESAIRAVLTNSIAGDSDFLVTPAEEGIVASYLAGIKILARRMIRFFPNPTIAVFDGAISLRVEGEMTLGDSDFKAIVTYREVTL